MKSFESILASFTAECIRELGPLAVPTQIEVLPIVYSYLHSSVLSRRWLTAPPLFDEKIIFRIPNGGELTIVCRKEREPTGDMYLQRNLHLVESGEICS